MPKNRIVLVLFMLCGAAALCAVSPGPALTAPGSKKITDHSNRKPLQQDFASVHDVTKACLKCHAKAAKEIQQTTHWKLIQPNNPGQNRGKGGITFNNFCVSMISDEPRCTSCHVGYGWKDQNFDFSAKENIDCLVCHDRSESYRKYPAGAGYPVEAPKEFEGAMYYPPDYKKIFKSIGRPGRNNCGVCHFFGGGGDAVKHGDMDSSLYMASRDLDVHLSKYGANLDCRDCHLTTKHSIAGRGYAASPDGKIPEIKNLGCTSCHGEAPHAKGHPANRHLAKIACQTCHIPTFARAKATKMSWDWSTAGTLRDGKPFQDKNADGNIVYDSKKGDFTWQKDVVPVYMWYSGSTEQLLFTDEVDATNQPVDVKKINGSAGDPNSKIMPFKLHRSKQPFDPKLKRFLGHHVFGQDDSAYWTNFIWPKAIAAGQKALGLPWSGEYTFVETNFYYPISHMVAPKEMALTCNDCHSEGGRLQAFMKKK